MYCTQCSRQIPDSARFCPHCGAKVPVPGQAEEFEAERTSGLAIASLVLGILGWLIITALAGVVLGVIALVQIQKSKGKLGGKGLAIGGLALSALFIVMLPMMAAIMFPVIARSRDKARQVACMSNLKQVALAAMMYAEDYDGRLPLKDNWQDALYPYTKNNQVFRCPSGNKTGDGYAFNASLSGMWQKDIPSPEETVLFFDASGEKRNAGGGPELAAKRHSNGLNVAFVDGHVRWARDFTGWKWKPETNAGPPGNAGKTDESPSAQMK